MKTKPTQRIVLCERGAAGEAPIQAALETAGIAAVRFHDPRALVEDAARKPPDVVICDLAVGCREDLFMLELLRRVAPDVPLILVASEESLVTQRLVQKLRPIYYMVEPVEATELGEAVAAAVARRSRARRSRSIENPQA
jgi:DNA-binding NtrC family response regulator